MWKMFLFCYLKTKQIIYVYSQFKFKRALQSISKFNMSYGIFETETRVVSNTVQLGVLHF